MIEKSYWLYVEDVGPDLRQQTIDEVSKVFPGFTLTLAFGYWEGKSENTLVFEIISKQPVDEVYKLAQRLCCINKQEEVLLKVTECATARIK